MIIYISVLLPVLFFCFFLLFIFSRQDFVLLRQNISLAQIFDLAGVVFVSAFIFGRVFLIANELNLDLLSILTFFHIFRFPGISTLGFFIGGATAIYFSLKSRKSIWRIYDIFSIAFFPLLVFLVVSSDIVYKHVYLLISLVLVSSIILYFFIMSHHKYILRDGNISLLFVLLLALDSFISNLFSPEAFRVIFNLSPMQILSIPIIILSITFFARRQFLNRKHA